MPDILQVIKLIKIKYEIVNFVCIMYAIFAFCLPGRLSELKFVGKIKKMYWKQKTVQIYFFTSTPSTKIYSL